MHKSGIISSSAPCVSGKCIAWRVRDVGFRDVSVEGGWLWIDGAEEWLLQV